MQVRIPVFIVSALFIFSSVWAQNNLRAKISRKYWAFAGISHENADSTIDMDAYSVQNMQQIMTTPYHSGFILNDGGSFEEIIYRRDNFDRKPYTGTWQLQHDTVIVHIANTQLTWYFHITHATDSNMAYTYWSK